MVGRGRGLGPHQLVVVARMVVIVAAAVVPRRTNLWPFWRFGWIAVYSYPIHTLNSEERERKKGDMSEKMVVAGDSTDGEDIGRWRLDSGEEEEG